INAASFDESAAQGRQNREIVRGTAECLEVDTEAGRPLSPETIMPSLLWQVTVVLNRDQRVNVQDQGICWRVEHPVPERAAKERAVFQDRLRSRPSVEVQQGAELTRGLEQWNRALLHSYR